MRPWLTIAAAFAVALLSTACGSLTHETDVKPAGTGSAESQTSPGGESVVPSKSEPGRPPRKELSAQDMASAKTAVVHRANLYDFWEQVAPPKPGHCAAADPDLSKLTLTGEARSAFRAEHSRIVSVVKIFRNGDMASEYLRSHVGAGELGCIRRGMTRYFQEQGISVKVLAARIDRSPPLGAESAIYSLQFLLSKGDGPSDLWPFQMYLFRVGRAVGVISFDFVATDQLKVARRVASNLDRV